MDEVRYWMVKEVAPKPLDHARGSRFDYSNLVYIIAGAILERLGGKPGRSWSPSESFEPLDLNSAGFGPQASLGKTDAPLGHLMMDGKRKRCWPAQTETILSFLGPPAQCTCQSSILQNGSPGMPERASVPPLWFQPRS